MPVHIRRRQSLIRSSRRRPERPRRQIWHAVRGAGLPRLEPVAVHHRARDRCGWLPDWRRPGRRDSRPDPWPGSRTSPRAPFPVHDRGNRPRGYQAAGVSDSGADLERTWRGGRSKRNPLEACRGVGAPGGDLLCALGAALRSGGYAALIVAADPVVGAQGLVILVLLLVFNGAPLLTLLVASIGHPT